MRQKVSCSIDCMRNMGLYLFFVFIVEELSNALAEIRKSEKEMSMIAMVAQTLIERTNDL